MSKYETIIINGKEYPVRRGLYPMLLWEQVTGKAFQLETMSDSLLYFYCTLLGANESLDLTFEDFADGCTPDVLKGFKRILSDQVGEMIAEPEEEASTAKKN